MAERYHDDPDALIGIERAVTVQKAADAMDLDESTVRKMLRTGELRGFRAGAGHKSMRVFVSSIREHQANRLIIPDGELPKPQKPKRERSASHKQALATLAALGILKPAPNR